VIVKYLGKKRHYRVPIFVPQEIAVQVYITKNVRADFHSDLLSINLRIQIGLKRYGSDLEDNAFVRCKYLLEDMGKDRLCRLRHKYR
jgi:hypothetical protein